MIKLIKIACVVWFVVALSLYVGFLLGYPTLPVESTPNTVFGGGGAGMVAWFLTMRRNSQGQRGLIS